MTTILSTVRRGIKMRRLGVLLLLLALLLVGCSSRFSVTEGGYLDGKTQRRYVQLSDAYEAASSGEEVGAWESELYDSVLTFREIPTADPESFLTDDIGTVYCADEVLPDASLWNVKSILVCDENAVSVAVANITNADLIAQIRALWAEGEQAEKPEKGLTVRRRLKMVSDDCPGIYYCVLYLIYDDGTAYFYDRDAARVVQVSEELKNKIPIT